MTAAELIDCLMHCDPNMEVTTYGLGGAQIITSVEEGDIVLKAHPLVTRKVVNIIGRGNLINEDED